jgi:phosphoserine phosphatase
VKKNVPNKIFLWDIDGTVVSPSLESQFIAFLRDRRLVPSRKFAWRFMTLALAHAKLPWHQLKIAYLKGESVARVDEWVEAWWPTAMPSVRAGARTALLKLGEAGATQLFLSGTLQTLGERLASEVGIKDVIAARPEIARERYTGSLLEPHPQGQFKVTYAKRWLGERNIDWANVVALADHEGDQFLLERAGVAVAVNPRPALETLARERQWHVVADADLPALVKSLL